MSLYATKPIQTTENVNKRQRILSLVLSIEDIYPSSIDFVESNEHKAIKPEDWHKFENIV